MWWPYVRDAGAGGSCGPGFPPETAFGRREPEKVAAKPFGFLTEQPAATRHRVLSGYARSHVARVRVLYEDREGMRHDAPVKLGQVTGSLLEQVEAGEPFGYWVAFVPPSSGRRSPIEVIAYGADGQEAGRYTHRE